MDIDGDGKADVCGRGGLGINCGISSGTGFGPITVWQADYSDANGWNGGAQFYSTIRYAPVAPGMCQ